MCNFNIPGQICIFIIVKNKINFFREYVGYDAPSSGLRSEVRMGSPCKRFGGGGLRILQSPGNATNLKEQLAWTTTTTTTTNNNKNIQKKFNNSFNYKKNIFYNIGCYMKKNNFLFEISYC
jgi:hypothetical protein